MKNSKKSNSDKTKKYQIVTVGIVTVVTVAVVTVIKVTSFRKTTGHLDNWWDFLGEVFCDSRKFLYQELLVFPLSTFTVFFFYNFFVFISCGYTTLNCKFFFLNFFLHLQYWNNYNSQFFFCILQFFYSFSFYNLVLQYGVKNLILLVKEKCADQNSTVCVGGSPRSLSQSKPEAF